MKPRNDSFNVFYLIVIALNLYIAYWFLNKVNSWGVQSFVEGMNYNIGEVYGSRRTHLITISVIFAIAFIYHISPIGTFLESKRLGMRDKLTARE